MRFRPCIDLHDGAVKQIVGGTLRDGDASSVTTNFVASAPAAAFARRYAAAAARPAHDHHQISDLNRALAHEIPSSR